MSQGTFWDADEKAEEKAAYEKSMAKITLANLLEADLKKEAAAVKPVKPRRDFRIGASQPEPEPEPEPTVVVEEETITAEHIAAQLIKLWRRGLITGAEDPSALLYAALIKESGGTVMEQKAITTGEGDEHRSGGAMERSSQIAGDDASEISLAT